MAKLYLLPSRPARDSAGETVPGSLHYFTLTGSNTASAPFADADLITPLENPVEADGIGLLPPVYLDPAKVYRVRIYLPDARVGVDTPLEEYDPYVPALDITTLKPDIGLFVDASDVDIADGIDIVATSGADELDHGAAVYVSGAKPTARSGFTSANGRNFVLSKEQVITTAMFYEATDADYQNAIQGALDYAEAVAVDPVNVWYKAGPKIVIPAHSSEYVVHDTFEPKHIGIIEGEDIGWFDSHATRLRMNGAATMWRFQDIETAGDTGTAADHLAPTGSIIRNMFLTGYLGTVATEAENHAIQARTRVKVENVGAKDWQGDFIHINADVTVGQSNASFAQVEMCRAYRIRNGIYLDGGDANVISVRAVDIPYARQWCFWDSSFLGGRFEGCHSANGGAILQPGYTPSVVSYGGNLYAVRPGQETGAATNAPTGTTAHNTWWFYIGAGGASVPLNVPAWVSGVTVRAGGSYRVDGTGAPTSLDDCYAEGGQGPSVLAGQAIAYGGAMTVDGARVIGYNGTASGENAIAAVDQATGIRTQVGSGASSDYPILIHFNSALGGVGAATFGWGPISNPTVLHWTNWRNYYGADAVVFQISVNNSPLADAPYGRNRLNFGNGFGLGGALFIHGTAAPTGPMVGGGNWPVGSRVFNSAPAVGQPQGWVCTVAGSPGTWVSMGNL